MRYAQVENGTVIRTFYADSIPAHKAQSFLPVTDVVPSLDEATEVFTGDSFSVNGSQVICTRGKRTLSLDEQRELVREKRKALYPDIGDAADAIVKIVQSNPELTIPDSVLTYVNECVAVKNNNPLP